jgi:dihydrofolate reductase
MTVSLIVAMAENRVIGRGNQLPWRLPDDLKRFRQLTMGHAIIMGRTTFESIGKALPGRRSIVISRQGGWPAQHGVHVARSLAEALAQSRSLGDDEAFVIGGAQVFREALPHADRIYLTLVHASIDGDAYFPDVDWRQWRLVDELRHEADDHHTFPFSFRRYDRIANAEPA